MFNALIRTLSPVLIVQDDSECSSIITRIYTDLRYLKFYLNYYLNLN